MLLIKGAKEEEEERDLIPHIKKTNNKTKRRSKPKKNTASSGILKPTLFIILSAWFLFIYSSALQNSKEAKT
jgi:hypothetical protein